MINSLFLGVIDLKASPKVIHAFPWIFQGDSAEYKQAYFLSGYGSPSFAHLSKMCFALSRQSLRQEVSMLCAISRHDFLTTHSSFVFDKEKR